MKKALATAFLCALSSIAVAQSLPHANASTHARGHGVPFGFTGSSPAIELAGISDDPTYGQESNPIKVGNGPSGEKAYLSSLAGPNGEKIVFERVGSCCAKASPPPMVRTIVPPLDIFQITYPGIPETVYLYLNMYERGELKAAMGFRPAP